MKHLLVRSAMPLLILAAGVAVMLAMGSRKQETREPENQRQVPQLETIAVQSFAGDLTLETDGVVAPLRDIEVAAEVMGRVHFKSDVCRAGHFVPRGTPLLEIDPRDYELAVLQSQKQQEQAEAELAEIDVDLSNIESLIVLAERDRELQQNELDRVLRISRSISESEADRARRAVLVADNTLQTLKNQLRANRVRRNRLQIAAQLAHAALQKAQLDLERTKIAAPVDGVIVRDSAEEGSFVQRGTALFTIQDTSSVEVQVSLEMNDLYWLWRQRPAADSPPAASTMAASTMAASTMAASTMADDGAAAAYRVPRTAATVIYQFAGREDLRFSWQGTLTRFEGSGLDERTRTAPCRVVVARPREATPVGSSANQPAGSAPPALVRGMFVSVLLHVRLDTPLVRIPDETVQPGKRVWRVRDGRLTQLGPLALVQRLEERAADGQLHRYWVTPAQESNLSPSDQLVLSPPEGLADGAQVEIRTVAPDAAGNRQENAGAAGPPAAAGLTLREPAP